jgi:hypothetical protein
MISRDNHSSRNRPVLLLQSKFVHAGMADDTLR